MNRAPVVFGHGAAARAVALSAMAVTAVSVVVTAVVVVDREAPVEPAGVVLPTITATATTTTDAVAANHRGAPVKP